MRADWRGRLQISFTGHAGGVIPLFVLLPLALSSTSFNEIIGIGGGATAQKMAVLGGLVVAVFLLGVRIPPLPVWVVGSAVTIAYIVGLVTNARAISGFDVEMLFGAAGLVYPWLAFFVNWRRISTVHKFFPLAVAPLFAILFAAVVQLTGLLDLTLVRHEYTGALRLSAGMPPAFLAGLSLIAVAASLLLWVRLHWIGLYLAVVNCAIVALTGTRMATAVAGFMFIATLILAVVRRYPHWLPAIVVTSFAGVAGAIFIVPNFLQRISEASGGGMLRGSGRELAWSYFFERFLERPVTGFGPGSGPLLAEQAGSHVVRDFFVSPHNTYLTIAIDLGVVLALVFFGAIVWFFVSTARTIDGDTRWWLAFFAVATLIYAGFDNLLTAPQSAVPFCLLLALLWNDRGDSHGTSRGALRGSPVTTAGARFPTRNRRLRATGIRDPRHYEAVVLPSEAHNDGGRLTYRGVRDALLHQHESRPVTC